MAKLSVELNFVIYLQSRRCVKTGNSHHVYNNKEIILRSYHNIFIRDVFIRYFATVRLYWFDCAGANSVLFDSGTAGFCNSAEYLTLLNWLRAFGLFLPFDSLSANASSPIMMTVIMTKKYISITFAPSFYLKGPHQFIRLLVWLLYWLLPFFNVRSSKWYYLLLTMQHYYL